MASSEDETKPSGSSLNLFKYNVRATINRHTATATNRHNKKRSYSSQTSSSSLSYKRRIRNDNTSGCSSSQGATTTTTTTTTTNNTGASNSNNKRKKRTRKEVLASISANAKKLTIPIPSFKMTNNNNDKKNDGTSNSRLSRLERAFFDEESDDSSTSSTSSGDDDDSCLFDDELNKRNRTTNNNNTDKKPTASKDNDNNIKHNMVSSSRKVEDVPKDNNLSVIVEVKDDDDDETETDDSDDEIPSFSIVRKRRRKEQSKASSTVPQIEVVPKQVKNKTNESLNMSSLSVSGESTNKLKGADIDDNKKHELKGDDDDDDDDDKEEEIETDNNCVDFQDGDGDDNVNVNGDEKDIKLSSTNMNETEDREVLVPLAFDLDREIDLLFLNSDSNTITVNIFNRELESQTGKSLDKVDKKKVKARLVSLINGRVKPIADTRTITSTVTRDVIMQDKEKGGDVIVSKSNVGENEDNKAKFSMEIQGIGETSCNMTDVDEKRGSDKSHIEEEEKEMNSDRQIIIVDENSSSIKPQNEKTKRDSRCQTKVVDEKSGSGKLQNEKAGNEMSFRMDVVDEKNSFDKSQKEKVGNESTATFASQKSTQKKKGKSDRSQVTKKSKKPPTTKKRTQKTNTKNQTEERTNPESGDNKEPNPKASKSSRAKKSKPKVSDKDNPPTTGTTSAPIAVANRPRKRARSKLCAFCKTCSCQKADSNDIIPILDMNKFSRTNAAKEKALIRRLQNLEKKTENLEEQTEVARRQLKKHRRDLWKRKEREISNTNSSHMVGKVAPIDDYFLPDTEIFEKQQMESQALPEGLWEKAQIKVFPKAPSEYPFFLFFFSLKNGSSHYLCIIVTLLFCSSYFSKLFILFFLSFVFEAYQPTLTQMMGFSNNSEKSKENTCSEVTDITNDADKDAKNGETIESISKAQDTLDVVDDNDDGERKGEEDDIPTEYVPERECADQIQRFERNGDTRDTNDEMMTTYGSIWDTILPMTQEQQIVAVSKNEANSLSRYKSPWDELFAQGDEDPEAGLDYLSASGDEDPEAAGLDDLLGLFEDGAEYPVDVSCFVQNRGNENNPVDMHLLSQGAQVVASELISNFSSTDKTKATLLQRSCPNWKENISFALLQKDPNEIQDALENVRQSKMRLQATRQKILDAWESKNVALEVFESALVKSAARLKVDTSTSNQETDGGFLTQAE
jgi:hypothetical protein